MTATKPPHSAIVTGAGGVIGRAISVAVAARGAAVLAVDVDEPAALETAAAVSAGGGAAVAHAADVTSEEAVAGYVETAVQLWGGVDWFANNAGIEGPAAPIESFPADGFRRVLEVNVAAVFLGLKHVLPVMRRRGRGRVVNTASVAGLYATPQLVAYGASKHAVIGITRTAAIEAAGDGIAVNAICPGPQDSRMMDAIEANVQPDDPEGMRATYMATIPMGRYGRPDEIASTVVWLLADAPDYLTGQLIVVDGGLLVA